MSQCCRDCPCAEVPSEWIEEGQDLGCMPGKSEILKAYDKHGYLWACHANESRVCRGLVNLRGVDAGSIPTHGVMWGEGNFYE